LVCFSKPCILSPCKDFEAAEISVLNQHAKPFKIRKEKSCEKKNFPDYRFDGHHGPVGRGLRAGEQQ
jgi:hypothetical protein